MKKVYAVAPNECNPYLTPGKRYAVDRDDGEFFFIMDNDGDDLECAWRGCQHALGDWVRIDEDIFEDCEPTAKRDQIGGDHYLRMKIQPIDFSMANNLDACQHSIIKYVTRIKGGKDDRIEDLEKARHVIDLYIDWIKANV